MRYFFSLILLFSLPLSVFAKTPNDPLYDEQWYLPQINAPTAWDTTTGSSNVIVAVIDSGVDLSHPDLADQIWTNPGEIADDGIDNDHNGYIDDIHGWDFVGKDNDPNPGNDNGIYVDAIDHGTIVAGIIGATTNNDQGIAGVNWHVALMPLRILDGLGAGDTDAATTAVNYAVANGAKIINMSFTGFVYDNVLEAAVRNAYRKGVLVVAAVGNESGGGLDLNQTQIYPACMSNPLEDWVLGVAASDESDTKADFSNYGSDCTDVSAPGTNIYGSIDYIPGDQTFGEQYGGPFDGTSVATPQVTGVAALLKGAYPGISPAQIETAIKLSVDPLKGLRGTIYAGQMGAGRLNAANALTIAGQLTGQTVSSTPATIIPTPGVGGLGTVSAVRNIVIAQQAMGSNVAVLNADGSVSATWAAYPGFLGGVNVAVGDVDGDGTSDVITGAGVGGGPQVRIFSKIGALIGQFFAFDSTLRNGVNVVAGDVDGDGMDEIIATQNGTAHPQFVRVFKRDGTLLHAYPLTDPRFDPGVSVSMTDVDNDGKDDFVLATGPGVAPFVQIIGSDWRGLSQFSPYAPAMTSGLTVASRAGVVVVGTQKGAGSQMQVWKLDQNSWKLTGQFFAFDEAGRSGVHVALGDVDGDGKLDIVASRGANTDLRLEILDLSGNDEQDFSGLGWNGGIIATL